MGDSAKSGSQGGRGDEEGPTTGGARGPSGTPPGRPEDVLTDVHVLEYPYSRSVGPVIGAFLTGLREGRILGARGSKGRIVVPPTEYDPETAEPVGDMVDVGPQGTVQTWAWVGEPRPSHPLQSPFAWALIQLDGASTALLHVIDASSPTEVATGMRVVAEFLPEGDRVGRIRDIRAFVPVASGARGAAETAGPGAPGGAR